MKTLILFVALASGAEAQLQLPPGTTSATEQREQIAPATRTLQQAEEAITAGKYDTAVNLLTPLATTTEQDTRIFYDLGFAHDALNHDTEATAAYRAAIVRDPNNAAARVSLGLLLARGASRDQAEEQLASAIKIPGADPALLARSDRALAQIHLQTNPSASRTELLAALRLSPETPEDAALAAQIADALGDDSTQAWAHAAQLAPADPDTAIGYARSLSNTKKYAQAEAVLTTARRTHPENTELLAELASTELLAGEVEAALPLLDKLHATEPTNVAVALLQARAHAASGDVSGADKLYAALLATSPDDPVLLTETADSLMRNQRTVEAENMLLRALAHPDRFPTKHDLATAAGELAFAASTNEHPEVVLRALATREQIQPSDAAYTFLAATAHDKLHHTKQATDLYRLFLSQSGGKFPDQEAQAQQRLRVLPRTTR